MSNITIDNKNLNQITEWNFQTVGVAEVSTSVVIPYEEPIEIEINGNVLVGSGEASNIFNVDINNSTNLLTLASGTPLVEASTMWSGVELELTADIADYDLDTTQLNELEQQLITSTLNANILSVDLGNNQITIDQDITSVLMGNITNWTPDIELTGTGTIDVGGVIKVLSMASADESGNSRIWQTDFNDFFVDYVNGNLDYPAQTFGINHGDSGIIINNNYDNPKYITGLREEGPPNNRTIYIEHTWDYANNTTFVEGWSNQGGEIGFGVEDPIVIDETYAGSAHAFIDPNLELRFIKTDGVLPSSSDDWPTNPSEGQDWGIWTEDTFQLTLDGEVIYSGPVILDPSYTDNSGNITAFYIPGAYDENMSGYSLLWEGLSDLMISIPSDSQMSGRLRSDFDSSYHWNTDGYYLPTTDDILWESMWTAMGIDGDLGYTFVDASDPPQPIAFGGLNLTFMELNANNHPGIGIEEALGLEVPGEEWPTGSGEAAWEEFVGTTIQYEGWTWRFTSNMPYGGYWWEIQIIGESYNENHTNLWKHYAQGTFPNQTWSWQFQSGPSAQITTYSWKTYFTPRNIDQADMNLLTNDTEYYLEWPGTPGITSQGTIGEWIELPNSNHDWFELTDLELSTLEEVDSPLNGGGDTSEEEYDGVDAMFYPDGASYEVNYSQTVTTTTIESLTELPIELVGSNMNSASMEEVIDEDIEINFTTTKPEVLEVLDYYDIVRQPWQGRDYLISTTNAAITNPIIYDNRFPLGTYTENNRGFWEIQTFDETTYTSQMSEEHLQLADSVITSSEAYPSIYGDDVDFVIPSVQSFSVDALAFKVSDNKSYPLCFYYDKDLHREEYEATTEGKVSLKLVKREPGRPTYTYFDPYSVRSTLSEDPNPYIPLFTLRVSFSSAETEFSFSQGSEGWGNTLEKRFELGGTINIWGRSNTPTHRWDGWYKEDVELESNSHIILTVNQQLFDDSVTVNGNYVFTLTGTTIEMGVLSEGDSLVWPGSFYPESDTIWEPGDEVEIGWGVFDGYAPFAPFGVGIVNLFLYKGDVQVLQIEGIQTPDYPITDFIYDGGSVDYIVPEEGLEDGSDYRIKIISDDELYYGYSDDFQISVPPSTFTLSVTASPSNVPVTVWITSHTNPDQIAPGTQVTIRAQSNIAGWLFGNWSPMAMIEEYGGDAYQGAGTQESTTTITMPEGDFLIVANFVSIE